MSRPDLQRGYHAIILAAGSGTRFGGAKLLADYRGRPLIVWAVETALATRVEGVVVVLGSHAADIRGALSPLASPRLRSVLCPDWRNGLSASLRCGISSLPAAGLGTLILLGDMPTIRASTADAVLTRIVNGASAVLPTFAGKPAHPVAVSRALFEQLDHLEGDRGARALLEDVEGIVRLAVCDPGAVRDVDTRQDLAELNGGAA